MDHRPRRSVEQVEVIEHHIIEEGRRPSGSSLPFQTIRTSNEFDRYAITGERDVSREPSFLHTSANYGQNIELSPNRTFLNTSGPRVEFADTTNNTIINNFGYDVHEVHTSEGGAKIVETHGAAPIRDEGTRIDDDIERPGITSALRGGSMGGFRTSRAASNNQIFTVPSPPQRGDSWRNIHSDSDSFVRKDSYKKMQQSDDVIGSLNTSKSFPQSQSSLVTRSSSRGDKDSSSGCWSKTTKYVRQLIQHLRTVKYTPRLIAHLLCILLFLILLLILFGIILNALFHAYSVAEFLLFPPVCEECRRKNPNLISAALPSSVFLHFYSSNQAHFELRGNLPFKSNSFTAIDFNTGFIAIADHALTDANGRHTVCFLMPLDRNAIDNIDQLREAAGDSSYEIQSTFGWQEFWQFDAEPIDSVTANNRFSERVNDCEGAKWYLLKQTVHAKDVSCSDCYDFCLPDWAVVRKEKYEDESTIGVRRLDCFRLYVPEWRNFRVETDISGGHFQYPLASQSTKRDQHGEWVHWVPTGKAFDRQRRR